MLLVQRLLLAVAPYIGSRFGPFGHDTPLARVRIWQTTRPTPPTPAMFQPMFYAVLQGTKVLTIRGSRFALDAGDCAISSFGLPYVGECNNASQDKPFIAISLGLDPDMLTDVILDMPKTDEKLACPASGAKLEGALGDAFGRLIELLETPEDQAMLRPYYERELYYRLLQSSMGATLRQIAQHDDRRRKIKEAADRLCINQDKPVIISELAAAIGMSRTSFHRHFRAVTGYSPLAFQRHMRLLEARKMLAAGSSTVSNIARAVGYLSPSQFSREYKIMFGRPPVVDQGVAMLQFNFKISADAGVKGVNEVPPLLKAVEDTSRAKMVKEERSVWRIIG